MTPQPPRPPLGAVRRRRDRRPDRWHRRLRRHRPRRRHPPPCHGHEGARPQAPPPGHPRSAYRPLLPSLRTSGNAHRVRLRGGVRAAHRRNPAHAFRRSVRRHEAVRRGHQRGPRPGRRSDRPGARPAREKPSAAPASMSSRRSPSPRTILSGAWRTFLFRPTAPTTRTTGSNRPCASFSANTGISRRRAPRKRCRQKFRLLKPLPGTA